MFRDSAAHLSERLAIPQGRPITANYPRGDCSQLRLPVKSIPKGGLPVKWRADRGQAFFILW